MESPPCPALFEEEDDDPESYDSFDAILDGPPGRQQLLECIDEEELAEDDDFLDDVLPQPEVFTPERPPPRLPLPASAAAPKVFFRVRIGQCFGCNEVAILSASPALLVNCCSQCVANF